MGAVPHRLRQVLHPPAGRPQERKHEWADNLAKKEALIAEAEQLAQSTEWDKAAARIKQLQAEWKKIGPVRKNKSEVVWQRFRAACDTFFERYKTRDQVAIAPASLPIAKPPSPRSRR